MSGNSDQVKGRAKEAVGAVTGNKHLESEGKADRLAGDVKGAVDHVMQKIKAIKGGRHGRQ